MSEELVPRDEVRATVEARKELGEEAEPALIEAFVDRIEKELGKRQRESEQSLRRKREHQKEMVPAGWRSRSRSSSSRRSSPAWRA